MFFSKDKWGFLLTLCEESLSVLIQLYVFLGENSSQLDIMIFLYLSCISKCLLEKGHTMKGKCHILLSNRYYDNLGNSAYDQQISDGTICCRSGKK